MQKSLLVRFLVFFLGVEPCLLGVVFVGVVCGVLPPWDVTPDTCIVGVFRASCILMTRVFLAFASLTSKSLSLSSKADISFVRMDST